MVRKLKTIACHILVYFCAIITLPASSVDPEQTVEFNFSALSVGAGDFSNIYYMAPDESIVKIEMSRYRRSAVYSYRGPENMTFYSRSFDADGEPVLEPVGTVDASKNYEQALIFFTKPNNNLDPLPYTIFLANDDAESFPANTIRVFNGTGVRLFGRVNDIDRSFEFGISDAIPWPMQSESGRFRVGFAVETRDGPRIVFQNQLEYSVGNRVILMLEPPRRPGSIRIQAFSISESAM